MEKIVAHKKDLKHYLFINYILYNYGYKTIDIVFNDIVSDDIGDIVENQARSMTWDNEKKQNAFIKVADGLFISKGLERFIPYFSNERMLMRFNKFILVSAYSKLKERMNYI